MRRRFLADEIRGDLAYITGQNAAHLARVLRARVGQEFEIAADGLVRLGKITDVADDHVEFSLGDEIHSAALRELKLLISIFKFDRMEWAIEKATELGATEIIPFIARRTDSHLAQSAGKRIERWRRIAHEASQQSRRVSPPIISDPIKLKEAIAVQADLRIVLAESEQEQMLRDVAQTFLSVRSLYPGLPSAQVESHELNSIALAFGPEGGWTDDELSAFAGTGWKTASLGPLILRAETAVVASAAIIASLS